MVSDPYHILLALTPKTRHVCWLQAIYLCTITTMPKSKGRPSKGSVNFQLNGLWSATVSAQNLKHSIAQVRLAFDFVQEIVQPTKTGGELHLMTCSDKSCSARLTYELQPSTSEYLLVHGWHCHPNKFGVTSTLRSICGTSADQLWRQKSFSFNDNPPRL